MLENTPAYFPERHKDKFLYKILTPGCFTLIGRPG